MPGVPRNLLDLTILRPHPQPNESETVAVKAAICVLINTPEDSGAHYTLRTTSIRVRVEGTSAEGKWKNLTRISQFLIARETHGRQRGNEYTGEITTGRLIRLSPKSQDRECHEVSKQFIQKETKRERYTEWSLLPICYFIYLFFPTLPPNGILLSSFLLNKENLQTK